MLRKREEYLDIIAAKLAAIGLSEKVKEASEEIINLNLPLLDWKDATWEKPTEDYCIFAYGLEDDVVPGFVGYFDDVEQCWYDLHDRILPQPRYWAYLPDIVI